MNNILDEDEIKEVIDKRVSNPLRVALIDLTLLFILNFIFVFEYESAFIYSEKSMDIFSSLYQGALFSSAFLFLSLFLESLRFLFRTLQKSKHEKTIVLLNPFWLQVIEGGFGMSIILCAASLFFYCIELISNF